MICSCPVILRLNAATGKPRAPSVNCRLRPISMSKRAAPAHFLGEQLDDQPLVHPLGLFPQTTAIGEQSGALAIHIDSADDVGILAELPAFRPMAGMLEEADLRGVQIGPPEIHRIFRIARSCTRHAVCVPAIACESIR